MMPHVLFAAKKSKLSCRLLPHVPGGSKASVASMPPSPTTVTPVLGTIIGDGQSVYPCYNVSFNYLHQQPTIVGRFTLFKLWELRF